ncbi:hypothetical protein ACIOJD_05660 [Streptomyces sp. NPDC088116]|uniref:hypothetical protein n=1 Tax=Streptomyces sp. NPDC088116 TaxID=3365825 RepID=UPI003803C1ED
MDNGIKFISEFVTTGLLHGVGIGTPIEKVDQAFHVDFIEENDRTHWLRRDYGFVEISFSGGPDWVMTGVTIELHRLPSGAGSAEEWGREMHVDFASYTRWANVQAELLRTPGSPALKCTAQGEFLEYHAAETKMSITVVNNEDERDDWPGKGDIWSVGLG